MNNLAKQVELKTATRAEIQAFLKLVALAKPERALDSITLGVRDGRLAVAYRGRAFSGYQKIGPYGYEDAPTVAVPYSLFCDAIKAAGETVAIHWDKKTLTVESGDARQTVPVLEDASASLPIGPMGSFWVPSLFFTQALPALLKIAAADSPRNYGTVIRFECQNGTGRLVATDGFRLAFADYDGMPHASALDGLSVPYLACQQILQAAKSGEPLHFGVSEDQTTLTLNFGWTCLCFRTSAVKYPNYRGVLPKTTRGQSFVTKELLATVKRALLGSDKSRAVSIVAKNGKMLVRAKHDGDADFRVCVALELPGHFDLDGKEFCLNGRFLVDALGSTKEQIGALSFPADENDPVTLTLGAVSTIVVPIMKAKK